MRTTNPVESTFATVRLRRRVTKGPGSRAASVAMAFKLIESAQARWRTVNAPHLVALVRARAKFERGQLVDRPAVTAQRTYTKDNPMTELNAEHARRAIVEHTRRLAESAAAAAPDAAADPAQLPTEMAVLPTDPREWQAWLSQSAQRVASACSDDALDAPVFNPAGDDRPGTRFWLPSLVYETVVHGFDAANAAADRPADTDAGIAAALISNHLAMLTSPTWQMRRPESAHAIRGTGQTLQWLATDTADDAGAWFVQRRPDGATWQPGTHQADVTVTGPRIAVADLDPTTPAHRPRSHQHQRRRRHRPRPALARQHRPCQRLTGTDPQVFTISRQ